MKSAKAAKPRFQIQAVAGRVIVLAATPMTSPLRSDRESPAFLPSGRRGPGSAATATALVMAATAAVWSGLPAMAQSESFLLKRGSNVGPSTRIKPVNCVTAADGSVTCNTAIENSPSDTPAKPDYSPFKN